MKKPAEKAQKSPVKGESVWSRKKKRRPMTKQEAREAVPNWRREALKLMKNFKKVDRELAAMDVRRPLLHSERWAIVGRLVELGIDVECTKP